VKKLLIIVLLIALPMAGCVGGGKDPAPAPLPDPGPGGTETPPPVDLLEGLTKDEYPGIEMSADVLERMALLPGMPVPVTVVVQNKGDKTVSYVQGSGSFETPQALFLRSDSLQPVIPRDQLGIMTMDFVTKELKPGESLLFKFSVMAIEPNAGFDGNTQALFLDEETYIADLEWPALQERYPDLTAVKPGSYTVSAFFIYTMASGDGEADIFGGGTGYAQADCAIGIS